MRPLPRRSWWVRPAIAILRWLLGALFRIKVSGLDNVPSGSYILAGNHLGWLDPLLLLACAPKMPPLHIVGAQEAVEEGPQWHIPLVRASGVAVPVDRSRPDRSLLEASLAILKRGDALVVFPEGTLGEQESQLLPLKRGIGFLALRSGRPIVPFAIRGASELFLGKEIELYFGPPIDPGPSPSDREAFKVTSQRLTQETAEWIHALFPTTPPREYPVKRWLWLTRLF